MKSVQKLLFIIVVLVFVSLPLFALTGKGTIYIYVVDKAGEPVPDIAVELVKNETNNKVMVTTSKKGRVTARFLDYGYYYALPKLEGTGYKLFSWKYWRDAKTSAQKAASATYPLRGEGTPNPIDKTGGIEQGYLYSGQELHYSFVLYTDKEFSDYYASFAGVDVATDSATQVELEMDALSLGSRAFNRGDYSEALTQYKKAAEEAPENEMIYYNIAKTYNKSGNNRDALTALDKVLELNPEYENVHMMKGDILKDLGELDSALTEYMKEYEYSPNSFNTVMKIADLLDQKGKLKDAAVYYEKALVIDGEDSYVLRRLSDIYFDLGENKKFKEVNSKLTAKSDNPLDFYNKGADHFNNNEIDLAIEALLKAVELKPEYAKAHDILCNCYLNKGNYEKAAEHARLFIKYADKGTDTSGAQGIIDWIESQ